jgi:hypothetical protein
VPTWLVVVDDQLLVRAGGASEWRKTVLPQLEALLR